MVRMGYGEGDWFGVPLRGGGFAIGLVARANSRGALLGYFFGPSREELPKLADLASLSARDAVLVGKFGHLGLKRKTWPLIGRSDGWDRALWPMPAFVRHEELTGRNVRVFYDENDPNVVLREERVPQGEIPLGPEDGLMGAGFTENRLSGILDPSNIQLGD
jgi:hypothetical protein